VHFLSVDGKDYWRCRTCVATFLDASQLPDLDAERTRYELHDNDSGNAAYRDFLGRLATPLLKRLPSRQSGLDYGSGPAPALALMLAEAGHTVRLYDPLFLPDAPALERTYDFITCTEVAEHFRSPGDEFERLDGLLRPGGLLAVMTRFLTDDDLFARWHYRRESSHVVFYKETTFRHVAARFGWQCELPRPDVTLMQKPG
jgi:hypothetical protein